MRTYSEKDEREVGYSRESKDVHVSHHGDLVVHGCSGPQEDAQLLVDGSKAPPVDERVEDELVASCSRYSATAYRYSCAGDVPYEYFCHRFSSSSAVRDTPSLNPPAEYVAQRMM